MEPFGVRDLRPWRHLALPTRLAPEAAAEALARNVGAARGLFGRSSDAPFTGTRVGPFAFAMRRSIAYRNSWLPMIDLRIEPGPSAGSLVRVKMRLHPFVAAFTAFWMFGALLGGALAAVAGLTRGEPLLVLFGLGFPLAGASLSCGAFAFEARRAEELLEQLLPP